MRAILSLFLLMFMLPATLAAQGDSSHADASHAVAARYGLIAGYHGFAYHHVELGFARVIVPGTGRDPVLGVGVSGELRVGASGAGTVLGMTASVWLNTPATACVGIGYYTNFSGESTLRLRPEIGIGLGLGAGALISYGYSAVLSGEGFNGVNKHDFSLRMFFPVR